MPRFAVVEGVRIYVHGNDHNPPHLHALIDEHDAAIVIKTGELLEGNLPRVKLKAILNWVAENRLDLLSYWNELHDE